MGEKSAILYYSHYLYKASKTDPFRRGCDIRLYHNQSNSCPISALQQYLQLRSQLQTRAAALLLFPVAGQWPGPFSSAAYDTLLQRLGLPEQWAPICGHSFRSGPASSAARAKVLDHLIKVLGRWSSDCYQRYIHTSPAQISWAQECYGWYI